VRRAWVWKAPSALAVTAALIVGVALPAGASEPTDTVLVRVEQGFQSSVAAGIKSLGGDPGGLLKVITGYQAKVPESQVGAVRALPGVVSVVDEVDVPFDIAMYNPEKVSSSLYNVAKNIEVDDLWADGYFGTGVDVAVIDSGIAPLPELAGRVVNGPDLSFDAGFTADGLDEFGHGTNMAAIIAGRDPSVALHKSSIREAAKTKFVGIAPGARLLNMKVAAANGAVDVSQVIAAIDWIVQHRNTDGRNVRVINLSFGTDGVQDYQVDPLTFAVENAWRHGIVVVVSAGNDGYGSPRLNNPAYDPHVLAVGAADTNGTTNDDDDFIAEFSSRGDASRRPDFVAPGRSIVSLRAPGTMIDEAFPGARIGDRFFRGSGTSQAAAVVSGAAAVLLQKYPGLTPDQVKAAFVAGGAKLRTSEGVLLEQGMRNIDVHKAVDKAKDVLENKIPSIQAFPAATGLGSLEAARGTEHVTDGETVLIGETDVTGTGWDARSWRDASWEARSWRTDEWNARSWRARSWRTDGWTARSWRTGDWKARSWRASSWRSSDWLAAQFVPTADLL
jgi:serine protease AprX